jgi:hypothetical protein
MTDLSQNWCERGASIDEAALDLSADQAGWWDATDAWDPDDSRAAIYTWFLTGMIPERRDIPGAGERRVDLTLLRADGSRELVEVLSTIDQTYQRDIHRAQALVRELNPEAGSAMSIAVSMAHGWTAPFTRSDAETKRNWRNAVVLAHRDVSAGHLAEETIAALQAVFPDLSFREVAEGGPGFFLTSWGARVEDSAGRPYLERLGDYLATDRQAVRHVEKLRDEAAELGADRTHLYLLVAGVGILGNLLPTTPGSLTEGEFVAPDGLTDLWLDGGTGFIGRWRTESGWTYHEV